MTTEEIYALLEARRLELGLTQLQLGHLAFGRPDTSAIQNLKRGSSPTFERLEAIAKALGLELYLGAPRPAGLADDPQASDLGKAEALRAGYVPIPWHDLARQKHRPPICVDQGWLDRRKLLVEKLAMVQPVRICTHPSSDELLAIIDRTAAPSAEAQVWAYVERGTVTVGIIQSERRALILHGAEHGADVRLVSDKEREAIPLLGRVVWSGTLA